MSLLTDAAEIPAQRLATSPVAGAVAHASLQSTSQASTSCSSSEKRNDCGHVILYYTNIRHQLLRSVKPPEKPLKLKVCRKDFNPGYCLDDSKCIKDLIESIKSSSSSTGRLASSTTITTPKRRSRVEGSDEYIENVEGDLPASRSLNSSFPIRNTKLNRVKSTVFLSEAEEKQKIRDTEREKYIDEIRNRIDSIPAELAGNQHRGGSRTGVSSSVSHLPTTIVEKPSSNGVTLLGGGILNSVKDDQIRQYRPRPKTAEGSNVVFHPSAREKRKKDIRYNRTKEALNSIVRGWVEERSGEHVPEVHFANEDRNILSQIEKGTFRMECSPSPPFFKPVTSSTSFSNRAKPPLAKSSFLLSPTPLPLLSPTVPESTVYERPATAPSWQLTPQDANDNSTTRLSTSQDTSSSKLQQYLQDINEQPIRSYRAFYNATVAPQKTTRNDKFELKKNPVGGSSFFRKEVERSQHRFDHMRFEKQVEIEDFIQWRGKCRGVVSATLANKELTTTLNEKQLKLFGYSKNSYLLGRSLKESGHGESNSPWLKAAMHLAVEEERNRLCECIESFKLDFAAATLSKEAMESLRANVLQKIRAKSFSGSDKGLFSREEFMSFLSSRTRKAEMDIHAAAMIKNSGSDVVDAMRSPAEAALAKYILKILPI